MSIYVAGLTSQASWFVPNYWFVPNQLCQKPIRLKLSEAKVLPSALVSNNIFSSGPTYHMLPWSQVNNCIISKCFVTLYKFKWDLRKIVIFFQWMEVYLKIMDVHDEMCIVHFSGYTSIHQKLLQLLLII